MELEDSAHPVSLCSTNENEGNNPQEWEESKFARKTFKIDNITVVKPPLLKIFYWQSLDIERLNDKLLQETNLVEHHLELPVRQLNSKPLKIVFWLKSISEEPFTIHIRRIKNCQCEPMETRVGFNQFRYLYHCPHRHLVNILQEEYVLKPDDLVAMSMVVYSYIIGTYMLSYELRVAECLTVLLHFHVDITIFDPVKCLLTTKLLPVNIKEHRSMYQPIWVCNITMHTLEYLFSTKERGFSLINPDLNVPRQSVWPLIVEFIPSDFENKLELTLHFGERTRCNIANRSKVSLTCKGYIDEEIKEEDNTPVLDYECSDFLYVVYPNKLVFDVEINEERSLMVAVHNYDQKCVEFRWQPYLINEYFSLNFDPRVFTLKPHHSKLCVVEVKTYEKPLYFERIPAVLEVHRILDKSTQLAKMLLTEIESIDDPKWAEDSYLQHVLLQVDLKVNFPPLPRPNIDEFPTREPAAPMLIPVPHAKQSISFEELDSSNQTIFEILFWDYLSKSNYMRNTSKISRNLSYEQVLNKEFCNKNKYLSETEKMTYFDLIRFLIAEACRDLSKNYRFIPLDF